MKSQHHGLKQALDKGVKSLHKWHSRVDGTSSPAYFICLGKYPAFLFYDFKLTANASP
jgi:hypothetical protein